MSVSCSSKWKKKIMDCKFMRGKTGGYILNNTIEVQTKRKKNLIYNGCRVTCKLKRTASKKLQL